MYHPKKSDVSNRRYWQNRWRNRYTEFHRKGIRPELVKHWPQIEMAASKKVLVPMCGKSNDLLWLASQGHHVVGIEFMLVAIKQFFRENKLAYQRERTRYGYSYKSDNLELVHADIYSLHAEFFSEFDGVYDGSALVTLPRDLRRNYVDQVYGNLKAACCGVLVSYEFSDAKLAGPPYPVYKSELDKSIGRYFRLNTVERKNIADDRPGLRRLGITVFDCVTYILTPLTE